MVTPSPASAARSARFFGVALRPAEIAGIAAILAASFAQLFVVRAAVARLHHDAPAALPWLFIGVLLAALLFARCRAGALPPLARLYLRGLALFALVFALTEPFDAPRVEPALAAVGTWLGLGRALAIACAVLAWWRPAFLLPALLYAVIGRALMAAAAGVAMPSTDFENVIEAAIFASAIGFAVPLARAAAGRFAPRPGAAEWPALGASLVVAASIGGHLGSYFHSGLAKLRLDGGPLSWMLDNQTQQGVLIALEKGTFPFAASPGLTQAFHDLVALNPVPGNILVVAVQLGAAAALLRARFLVALTLVFDLFHVGVYLIYGLFFWKWVFLNLVIVAAVVRSRATFTPAFVATGTAMTLFGQYLVWTAHLAWYDSANLFSPYAEAVTADGRAVRVPAAAFGSLSYPFSHGLLFVPGRRDGHLPMIRWGSYRSYPVLQAARRCRPAPSYRPVQRGSPERLARIVHARHAQWLARADRGGRVGFHLYPHHHYPSPFAGAPFGDLDLRSVVRYRWVLESVCLSLDRGRLGRRVIRRDEYDLGPVRAR